VSIILRDYQNKIVDDARAAMRSGCRSILIQSPTGSGKTALTAHMMKSASDKNMDSFFIVHRRELIKQSVLAFDKAEVFHGVVSAQFPGDLRPRVQIASIQSLKSRLPKLRKPQLIIWDECHHIAAGSWDKIFKSNPQAFHIGLTATPERLDGRGLGDYFKKMIKGPSVSDLIARGYLSPYRAYAPSTVSMAGVHVRMGDFVKREVAAACDKPTITGNAIKEYQLRANGKRAVVFACSIEHSKHIVEQFNRAGIPAAHVDGECSSEYRDDTIARFTRGEIKVLSNVGLFGEGFDLPAIECIIDLAPTMALGSYLQRFGRVLRPSPGKTMATYLDHSGNIERHGLPDEERSWDLNGRDVNSSGKKNQSVRVCPKCFAAQPSGTTVCLYCENPFQIQSREINEAEGELTEINADELKRRREQKRSQGQAHSMADLIALGKQRGYKKPYAWAKFIWTARQKKKIRGMA